MLLTRAGLGALGALVLPLVIISAPSLAFAQVGSTTLTTSVTSTATTTPVIASTTPTIDPYNLASVETAVRAYFADIPVMANIAKCESGFAQYNTSGAVLNGGSGGMIGVFQINKSVHAAFALSLGDDITTLAGNLAYARYLYTQQGTEPWDSSSSCWGNAALPAAKAVVSAIINIATNAILPSATKAEASTSDNTSVAQVSTPLTQNLKLGSTGQQVTVLQQLLNSAGYKIAKTGAGSPGQETTTFGVATKLAVERFQCTHNIACSGSEGTTGYGYVGAKTRAALMVN